MGWPGDGARVLVRRYLPALFRRVRRAASRRATTGGVRAGADDAAAGSVHASVKRRRCGFTLIEMVVTVAIVGVLAAGAFPLAELGAQRMRESELRQSLRQIRGALDAYKDAYDAGRIEPAVGVSGYPPNLAVLVDGVPDVTDPAGARIYFLRRIPRDPFHPDASLPPDRTWGKRSYASPPTAPREAADVFDVFSLSNRTGLNGIPYREW